MCDHEIGERISVNVQNVEVTCFTFHHALLQRVFWMLFQLKISTLHMKTTLVVDLIPSLMVLFTFGIRCYDMKRTSQQYDVQEMIFSLSLVLCLIPKETFLFFRNKFRFGFLWKKQVGCSKIDRSLFGVLHSEYW